MRNLVLTIGTRNYSSWSLRAWLALRLSGQAFEVRLFDLSRSDREEALAAISPSARVPVLDYDGGQIWDSLAIAETVAEAFPAAQLWPQDAIARAAARAITAEMHAGFSTLRARMPMNIRRRPAPVAPEPALAADIARVQAIWRQTRARFGEGGPFLFGRVSLADAFYAPVVTRFRSYAVPLDPICEAYAEAVLTLPAMQEWAAAARAETTVIPEDEA